MSVWAGCSNGDANLFRFERNESAGIHAAAVSLHLHGYVHVRPRGSPLCVFNYINLLIIVAFSTISLDQ